MLRVLPVLVVVSLWVYCIVEVVQADDARVRGLPRSAWMAVVVLLPGIGSLAWLVLGRPLAAGRTAPPATGAWGAPRTRTVGQPRTSGLAPDDDPAFLRSLSARAADHDRRLAQWEQDRQRREQTPPADPPTNEPPTSP